MAEAQPEEDPFKKGAEVEVCLEDAGFRGSWYTAKVLRTVTKKNDKILLQFDRLVAEDDDSQPHREYVNVILVRPIPPRESRRVFLPSDEVDGFHNDGWWEGIVISVLEGSRYSVFFRCSREQIEFHDSELRLHREWIKGKWVPPVEEQDHDDSSPQEGDKGMTNAQ